MYEYKTLLELSTLISRGISPKYSENGYAVINQRCIRDNWIDLGTTRVTDLETRINPEKFVKKYDVLVNSTGVGTLGRVAQVKEVFHDTTVDSHVTITRPNLNLVDGLYFGYGVIFRESYIETLGAGATGQTELSRHRLGDIEIPLPPLPTQRKIAAVLSAYDDLIENNTRRIQILEEMAKLIYREWFVHYRFPGHQQVKMVDSGTEFGEIPEGWCTKPISDVVEILGGGTPSIKIEEYWEFGDINWYTPSDLTKAGTLFMDESSRKITKLGLMKSSAKLFPSGSVMMTSRATLGVTAINTTPACTNQGFITWLVSCQVV